MIEQRSEEWFKQRVGLITGSRVGGILELCPFNKPNDIMRSMVREYHGAESEFKGNVATEYGNEYEDAAIFSLEQEIDIEVIETGFHKYNEWLGASPDGLVGKDAVVEIKCPYGKRNIEFPSEFKTLDEHPNYYAQMQIEMLCTHTFSCHFYQWSENAKQYQLVEFNPDWINENLPNLKSFHDEYLAIIASDELSKPFLEDAVVDKSYDEEWVKAEQAFNEANAKHNESKLALDKAKADLITLANGRKCASTSVTVFPVERKGSIKYAQIIKDQSIVFDAEKYQGKPSTSWTVKSK